MYTPFDTIAVTEATYQEIQGYGHQQHLSLSVLHRQPILGLEFTVGSGSLVVFHLACPGSVSILGITIHGRLKYLFFIHAVRILARLISAWKVHMHAFIVGPASHARIMVRIMTTSHHFSVIPRCLTFHLEAELAQLARPGQFSLVFSSSHPGHQGDHRMVCWRRFGGCLGSHPTGILSLLQSEPVSGIVD